MLGAFLMGVSSLVAMVTSFSNPSHIASVENSSFIVVSRLDASSLLFL
jgi:hypothetical protein